MENDRKNHINVNKSYLRLIIFRNIPQIRKKINIYWKNTTNLCMHSMKLLEGLTPLNIISQIKKFDTFQENEAVGIIWLFLISLHLN